MAKNDQIKDKVLQYAKKREIICVRDAISQGMHPEYLRRLCEKGLLVKMGRGTYIPADSEMPPDKADLNGDCKVDFEDFSTFAATSFILPKL